MRNATLPAAILLAALTLSATSCAKNPVAPDPAAPAQPGSNSSAICEFPNDPPGEGGNPNEMTLTVQPGDETFLVAGRFTLRLHKNSLQMPATITLRVDNPLATQVQIQVEPAAAAAFQVQPELVAGVSDLNIDYSTETMFYWDGAWEEMDGRLVAAHPNQQDVVAKLATAHDCKLGVHVVPPKKNAWGL